MRWYRVNYTIWAAGGRRIRTWVEVPADSETHAITAARQQATIIANFKDASAYLVEEEE